MPPRLVPLTAPLAAAVIAAIAVASPAPATPAGSSAPAARAAATPGDFVFNSAGSPDFPPDMGGSSTGWGSHFAVALVNDSAAPLRLLELGLPCAGPGPATWLVWLDGVAGEGPPPPPAQASAAGTFQPADDDPEAQPPYPYAAADLAAADLVVPAGARFAVGYENPGVGGMTAWTGTETWAWYAPPGWPQPYWDPDSAFGRTACIQLGAARVTPVRRSTLSALKALYR